MSAATFTVAGMTCADCSERLEGLLKADAAVADAAVLLMAGLAKLKTKGELTPADEQRLCGYGSGLGFVMARQHSSGGELALDVRCASGGGGLAALAARLAGVAGVLAAAPAPAPCPAGLALSYTPAQVGSRHLLGTLRQAPGVLAAAPCAHGGGAGARSGEAAGRLRRLAQCVLLVLASVLVSYAAPAPAGAYDEELSAALSPRVLASWALATLAVVLYFPRLFAAAWGAAVFSRTMTMDTLVCLSSGVAYAYSLALLLAAWGGSDVHAYGEPPFEAASVLLGLVALAREVDGQAKGLTQSALAALSGLQRVPAVLLTPAPCESGGSGGSGSSGSGGDCATCKEGEGEGEGAALLGSADVAVEVGAGAALPVAPLGAPSPALPLPAAAAAAATTLHPSLLHIGDVVRVAAGGVFPADGVVAWGSSSASEALVTGEPLPVAKGPGARVIGGSVNGEGELGVKVALLPASGTIARILALIEDAQTRRPRLQGTANAIAAVFTPAVLAASVVVLGAWWGAAARGAVDTRGLSPPAFALQFALSLLVVSCPCVVALAVAPVTHAATTLGARLGLLIKGGAALEALAGVTHVVFDKTGCLTTGRAGLAGARVVDARALQEVALSLGLRELPRLARGAAAGGGGGGSGAAQVPPCPLCPAAPKAASSPAPAAGPLSASAPPAPAAPAACSSCAALSALALRERQLLVLAAAVCAGTTHPLAVSICAAAARSGLPVPALPPLPCGAPSGTRATVPGCGTLLRPASDTLPPVYLGSLEWLAAEPGGSSGSSGSSGSEGEGSGGGSAPLPPEHAAAVAELRARGCSLVGLAVGGVLVGVLALRDALRGEAQGVVAALRARGLHVYIASGDHQGAVERVRRELAGEGEEEEEGGEGGKGGGGGAGGGAAGAGARIPAAQALGSLSPEGKGALVARLQAAGGRVAMVGDGVNDAPALARADVGIAMGVGSSEVAMECAGVVIRSEDLGALGVLFRLARRVRLHIALNFAWAALYNCVTMPLAAGVLYTATGVVVIPPGFSGLSELLSSVPVVLGSLAVYRFKA